MSTDRSPFPLSIRQLAHLLGAVPRLGQLPPRDHDLLQIERVVFDLSAIEPGSVYWDLHDPRNSAAVHPDVAYMHGALGVISCHRSEPWAGRFSIQLSDLVRGHQLAGRLAFAQWMAAFSNELPRSPRSPLGLLATR